MTHNMLNDIHNHWKHEEAVRIKCQGVPTVDMRNVWTQLEVCYTIIMALKNYAETIVLYSSLCSLICFYFGMHNLLLLLDQYLSILLHI